MALRLIEVYLPTEHRERLDDLVGPDAEERTIGIWEESSSDDQALVRLLVDVEETEELLDTLHQAFTNVEGFRVLLMSVEATLPRPEPPEDDEEDRATDGDETERTDAEDEDRKISRISREELYTQLSDQVRPSRTFLVLVVLSTVVAAVGLLYSNVAVIIGAMVIAPLLGPNVALSLATTLGDLDLAWRAIRVNASGIGVTFLLSILAGVLLQVSPDASQEIAIRTLVRPGDVVLALASGGAGALSFTLGLATAVVGVMVAVALLPPLVALGMLVGAGLWGAAFGALKLLLVNIICVNLAGVMTFLVQGVRPATWWEAKKARRATRRAIIVWALLLVVLIVIIALAPSHP